ncbi:MAG: S24 family peptidase [Gammaproteobacteria bacterium]|jgi:DNA polymerase V
MDLGGCGSSEPFALQVTDNSMEPEFKRGCIIVIDPAGVIEHGCYVLAMVENGYIFRQLIKEGESYFLQPLHEDYLHERREIELEAIQGVIVQQAGTTGKRADRKRYTSM